jgi:DNA-binding response OmpR family regulator
MAHILIADDDAAVADAWRSALEQDGHHVVVQTTGIDALRSARREPPDLLIAELLMPGGGGLALLGRLKLGGFDLKVIVTTGHPGALAPNVDGLGLARRFGADLTLEKPVETSALREAARRLLSSSTAEEAA